MNTFQTKVRPGLIMTVMNILCGDDKTGRVKNKKGLLLKQIVKTLKNPLKTLKGIVHPYINILLSFIHKCCSKTA